LVLTGLLLSADSGICVSTLAPCAAATCSAMFFRLASACWRMPSSNARTVPCSSALSGTMLKRWPPSKMPNVTTAGSWLMSSSRLTIVCDAVTISAAVTIGSMPFHGVAPWLCLPCTTMRKVSELAIAPPARTATVPTGNALTTCMPKIASGLKSLNTPSLTMSVAPPSSPAGAPSSAGWKMNITSPGRSFFIFAIASATPSVIAMCASCRTRA
jgi:hypothetical protein